MIPAQLCMWVNGERLAVKPVADLTEATVVPEALRMRMNVLTAVKDTWKEYEIAIVLPSKINCHAN